MKRTAWILAVCLFSVFPGCGNESWETKVRIAELESHIAILESQLEEYSRREQPREPDRSGQEEPPAGEAAPSPQEPGPRGSRNNPVPRGEEITVDHAHILGEMNVSIRVTEVLRGEDAVSYVSGINPRNQAPEGKELLLLRVHFALNSYSAEEGFLCSQALFTYYNSANSQITAVPVIADIDDLHARLFAGGDTEGWLFTAVDPADATPHAVFDNTIWFALYPGPDDGSALPGDSGDGPEPQESRADEPAEEPPQRDAQPEQPPNNPLGDLLSDLISLPENEL